MDIPSLYRKEDPPKQIDQTTPLHLVTQLEIINVDSIDMINMIVILTIEIRMKWHDERLAFYDPFMNRENMVHYAKATQIWTPLDDLIIENAIIGEITYDKHKKVQVYPNIPEDTDSALPNENRIYNGTYNFLAVSQRMKVKFNCKFDVYKFPFDEQQCHLVFKMNRYKYTKLKFVEDASIVYNGPAILDQFEIGMMTSKLNNTQQHTKYILTIPLNRIFTHQLLQTFIPTFILSLLGYSTIFVDIERPGDRFMGAVTIMLVLATVLNVVNGDLPKTSYVKLINGWFVWHIVITFVIIIYHILLDRISKQNNKDTINKVNRNAIIIFPIINGIFYAIYFSLTLN